MHFGEKKREIILGLEFGNALQFSCLNVFKNSLLLTVINCLTDCPEPFIIKIPLFHVCFHWLLRFLLTKIHL